eukprot:TRINITY_DN8550_c0_g1_i1.p2 TRINITY_DN8550_c0_g1~~TRINITY_DN8550_c0_g1_i1.p2  ORF type:complete len:109 (-),score=8.00 TRINITY_DN8550_c0_g1_i1:22-348(-)
MPFRLERVWYERIRSINSGPHMLQDQHSALYFLGLGFLCFWEGIGFEALLSCLFLGETQFVLRGGFLRDAKQGFLGGAGHRERSVLGALRLQKLRSYIVFQLWIYTEF